MHTYMCLYVPVCTADYTHAVCTSAKSMLRTTKMSTDYSAHMTSWLHLGPFRYQTYTDSVTRHFTSCFIPSKKPWCSIDFMNQGTRREKK
jgi:hypothetical protein